MSLTLRRCPIHRLSSVVGTKKHVFRLPEQPEFVFEEESAVRKRGWTENLQFYTGGGYLAGAGKAWPHIPLHGTMWTWDDKTEGIRSLSWAPWKGAPMLLHTPALCLSAAPHMPCILDTLLQVVWWELQLACTSTPQSSLRFPWTHGA